MKLSSRDECSPATFCYVSSAAFGTTFGPRFQDAPGLKGHGGGGGGIDSFPTYIHLLYLNTIFKCTTFLNTRALLTSLPNAHSCKL